MQTIKRNRLNGTLQFTWHPNIMAGPFCEFLTRSKFDKEGVTMHGLSEAAERIGFKCIGVILSFIKYIPTVN